MADDSLRNLLQSLRQQVLRKGADTLGSHQLNAHWSIAYACAADPQSWEIYRVPGLHNMPATEFYVKHPDEIQEAIRPHAAWELLRTHALPKLELDARMTEADRKRYSYSGNVQYHDETSRVWMSVDVPGVRWFDGRDRIRESLLETKDALRAKVAGMQQKYREAASKEPTAKRLQTAAAYEKYVKDEFPARLRKFDEEKAAARDWLSRLDATPDLSKTIFAIVRQAENEVRRSMGIPLIGEAWVSETELLYRVRRLLPGQEVIAHGQPRWLGRQHLDIWIPSLNVALEYHGVQHFRAIDYFGGDAAFAKGQERDRRKRELCKQNEVRLIEIAYDRNVDDITLSNLINRT
ncbi:hypothetical protein SAMN04487926_14527 [Paraburkholderia steynii]|uniref:Uncharacterized protein n=1 Tax=Paraburkholderia steynii TaxID=1245441 RepID=A0A7Z7FN68_9BURK|nr:hypothetical protein [Paraburkholderia steynii]SDJ36387.1 hypothetical protein SAMN04487926_14527 [Paraburkholderia steynii]